MTRLWLLALCASGCTVDYDFETEPLHFEMISPPQYSGGEVPFVARGNVVLTNTQITFDGGVSWRTINPAIMPSTAQMARDGEIIVNTTAFGYGRWNLETDQVNSVNQPGGLAPVHARATGTILAGTGTNSVGRQGPMQSGWSMIAVPAPPGGAPGTLAVVAMASNSSITLMSSSWGIYRSMDDGASWEFVNAMSLPQDIQPLLDGRFLVFAADRTAVVHDAAGMPTSTITPQFPGNSSRFPCLGGIVVNAFPSPLQITLDLGQTFTPIVDAPVPVTVAGIACDGDHALAFVTAPNMWLVPVDAQRHLGRPFPFYMSAPPNGDLVRAADGTFFVGGQSWKRGDDAWNVRFLPQLPIHALADGTLYAAQGTRVERSEDGGVTWQTSTVAQPVPDAKHFLGERDGTMWASVAQQNPQGVSNGAATTYRSDDGGLTWTMAHALDGDLTRARELVAIGDDATFVAATPYGALATSHDRAASWTDLPFPMGYRLAFVTHDGGAVTIDALEDGPVFHLWHDYGIGEAYKRLVPEVDGVGVNIEALRDKLVLDEEDHAYFLGAGIFRSVEPLR